MVGANRVLHHRRRSNLGHLLAHRFHRQNQYIVSTIWDKFCRDVLADETEHPDPYRSLGLRTRAVNMQVRQGPCPLSRKRSAVERGVPALVLMGAMSALSSVGRNG